MELDDQQRSVLTCLQEGANCSVEANPGTGKTTTILNVVAQMPQARFLIITFNNNLQVNTANEIQKMQLTNVDVFTYHQFVRSKYDPSVCDDCGLINYLSYQRKFRLRPVFLPMSRVLKNVQPSSEKVMYDYDVIVIDEIQDMIRTPYFMVAVLALIDNQRPRSQVVVMGDARQVVYGYRGADKRFLTLADRVFAGFHRLKSPGQWRKITFCKTYRLSPSVCSFVNDTVYHLESENIRLVSSEEPETCARNFPVTVFIDEEARCLEMVKHTIDQILEHRPDCPLESIVICCHSLKDGFLKSIMNLLTLNGYPVFVPSGASEGANESTMYSGRIRFYTRHSIKGLTCDYLLQINMNNAFYTLQQFYSPEITEAEMERHVMPPPHFVSLTRARVLLMVINVFSPRENRNSPRKLADTILPPYLIKDRWMEALEGRNPDFRVLGSNALACLNETEFLHGKPAAPADGENAQEEELSMLPPPPPAGFANRVNFKRLEVTTLCAFLSSDFLAKELWDIHSWFDKRSMVSSASPLSKTATLEVHADADADADAGDEEEDTGRFQEITEEDMPSRVLNIYGQLEDVSDLTGKAMAYFGYDYLRSRSTRKYFGRKRDATEAFGEFMAENGGLDSELRKLSLDRSVIGGDNYLTKFGSQRNHEKYKDLRTRLETAQRTTARRSLDDYLRAVAIIEAVKYGMYHRVLHFRPEDMNWIPPTAVHSCKRVIDFYIPSSEDQAGYRCEHPLSVYLSDLVPGMKINVRGNVDLLSERFLFEWKYKSSLQLEDLLQVIIYFFLYWKVHGEYEAFIKTVALLNIRTGTMYTLQKSHYRRAVQMVEKLIYYKVTNTFLEEDAAAAASSDEDDERNCGFSERDYQLKDEVFIECNSLANIDFVPAPEHTIETYTTCSTLLDNL